MEKPCAFCNTSEDDILNYGPIRQTKGVLAHYFCVLMTTSISQSGDDLQGIMGFLKRDILYALDKYQSRLCSYCGGQRASIRCFKKGCRKSFHLPCGLKNKCSFTFTNSFETFCDEHNHYPKISDHLLANRKNMNCVACLNGITDEEDKSDFLATPCCKLHLMHMTCAKKLAINSGYYTKCPICCNATEFVKGLQNHGVFVPAQDISWAQPRDTNPERDNTLRVCEADECACVLGRDYVEEGLFQIEGCHDCGAHGAHLACAVLGPFICSMCTVVSRRLSARREARALNL